MKILFPTDFSNAAENAYVYALKMAERLEASITVFHAYEVLHFPDWVEGTMNMADLNQKIMLGEFEEFREQIELLKRIAQEHHLADTKVDYSLTASDHVVDSILEEVKKSEADLIVMGTAGASGLKELFFGSVATKVLEAVNCPVFVVPESATYRGIERIGLTIDYKPGELAIIHQSLAIARLLGGHLHCLHVDVFDADTLKERLFEYEKIFKDEKGISFHVHYDLDIEKGILEFMKINQMDVVMMRAQRRNKLKELFSFSIARRIAYHTDIPLIALHDVTDE